MSKFIHLHTHSNFSLLNALPKIKELIGAAKEDGMDALALTDNSNLYGAIEFYIKCQEAEIKPILGIDAYVSLRTRFDKQAGIDKGWHRLILLAKNERGYKNIIKLVTTAHLEGFYYKPRIDKELIEKYRDNLVCISPSFSGDIVSSLKAHDEEKATDLVAWYKKIFPDFYIEITHHPEIEGHEESMEQLIAFAKKTNTPIVAAHDVYYIKPEDRAARETLLSVSNNAPRSYNEGQEDLSFISQKKAQELFKETPEALENTIKIAEMCNVEITLGKEAWKFPDYKLASGKTADEELRDLAYKGLEWRKMELTPEVKKRIEYELEIIKIKEYSKYFLVVADLLKFARKNLILSNTRGSAAGSLVSYLVGITIVDPIELKLPFERFLNPDRPSAPDIDMDFADARRDEVIEYTKEKYGKDHVAQIGTFGTMLARGSVRDTARALGFSYNSGDRIAKLIPMGAQGFPMTIDRALNEVPELKQLYKKDADTKTIIDMAKKIEGCARHIGVHAAGVVISPDPLTEDVPVQFDPKGSEKLITQYDMHAVGEDGVGLLKFDFLGLKNLTIMGNTVKLAKKVLGIDIDVDQVPLDDTKTYEMLARGETAATFQLNGSGMTKFLKDLKPSKITDINAMVALYRPGPMEFIPQYIERKHNPHKVKYLDPRLQEILDQSYGVITYQDDVMMIAIKLAGYSWIEADKLRKAMGKKIPEMMAEQKEKFFKGCQEIGKLEKKKIESLWKQIETFAAYGFNKCVSGDTRLTDVESGQVISAKELYESSKKINIHTLDSEMRLIQSPVEAVLENGRKRVYLIKTRSGREIKTTNNHPFLTMAGWQDLSKLKTGDRVAVPRIIKVKKNTSSFQDFEIATLGYLLAEGNLCHPHGVYFYSKSEEEILDFISQAKKMENVKVSINRDKSAVSVYLGQKDPKMGNKVLELLKKQGLSGKKATEKYLPKDILALPERQLRILLGKMWQGDGTVYIPSGQLFYATSSKQLAKDVQYSLLRLGILSTIHTKSFKYKEGRKTGYTVCLTHRQNICNFAEQIGPHLITEKHQKLMILSEKSKSIEPYAARGTKDTIPTEVLILIREIMNEKELTIETVASRTGLSERLFMKDSRKIGYQRAVILKIAASLESAELKSHATSDVYWDEIVSISKAGLEMTYDLTVNPYHNFVADNFIVHNSHAASYGRIAYLTSYLKANYPVLYMTSVLTAEQGDVDKVAEMIAECKRTGIEVLPPDINESFEDFATVGQENKIRFGLTTIKNFGEGIAHTIVEERKANGHFSSLSDFLNRIRDRNLNKKSLEALIKTGALDAFGERGAMLASLENLLEYNKELQKTSEDQDSLFGNEKTKNEQLTLQKVPRASMEDMLSWEKELLGLYVSGHPLDKFKEKLSQKQNVSIEVALKIPAGATAICAGMISSFREIYTKKGESMAFLNITDQNNSIEAVAFPKVLQEFKEILKEGTCIVIKGKVSNRNDEKSILIDKAKLLI